MRPFKFFFTLSVGLILFFFVAKVFFMALLIAGVLSLGYFLARKVRAGINYRRGNHFEEEDKLVPGEWPFEGEALTYKRAKHADRFFNVRTIVVQ